MNAPASTARRRGLAGIVDQVFSSLSNGLILYAIAVVSTAQYFGRIALLLTLLAAAIGCMRGALGTPLLLKAARGTDEIRREGSYAVTAVLGVSPLLVGVMWALQGTQLGTPAILVAVATPLVMVQDVLRYVIIAEGRPHVAAVWDGVWFAGSLALLLSTWLGVRFVDVDVLIAGWAALAATALLGLAINLRLMPRFRGFLKWLADDWQHRLRYGVDAGLEQGVFFLCLALVNVMVSPAATAALRGAAALMAPLAIFAAALPLVVIPESARRSSTPQEVWRGLAKVTMITSTATVFAGIFWRLLPDNFGKLLLGNTFGLSQQIVLIATVEFAIGLWCIAIMVYLKSFNRSAPLLALKSGHAILAVGLVIGCVLFFKSATGAAVGLAVASTLITAVALAWFTPWRSHETVTKDIGDEHLAVADRETAAVSSSGWKHKVTSRSRTSPRPLPDYVQLGAYRSGASGTSAPLIALWSFAILGVFGPVAIIQLTGPAPNLSWLGPLAISVICAARLSWILGSGERRLFECMFWIFTYAFMGLAPMTQIRERIWPITTYRMDSTLVWAGTTIVMVGLVAFLLGIMTSRAVAARSRKAGITSRLTPLLRRDKSPGGDVEAPTFTVNEKRIVLLAVLAIGLNIYFLSRMGWILFLQSRNAAYEIHVGAWSSTAMSTFIRAGTYMSLTVVFVALVRFRREANRAARLGSPQSPQTMRLNMALLFVIGILLFNTLNPISTARYLSGTALLAAAAAFGLFASAARFRLVIFGFIAALLVIFPVMDAFRYTFKARNLAITDPIEAFLAPDYDSFAQIMNGWLITQREGIDIGRQLVGVILFWVPRPLWPEKPVDTGTFIANSRGYVVTNLSAPLQIEVFVNGGFILLILVMFVAGYLVYAWDTNVERELALSHMPSVLGCILPFYTLILLRGSLLQAMPYLFVTICCWLFIRSRPPTAAKARVFRRPNALKRPERQPAHV